MIILLFFLGYRNLTLSIPNLLLTSPLFFSYCYLFLISPVDVRSVNPGIVWKADEGKIYEEGCLSVPNQFAEINRPKECHVKYLDYFGQPQLFKAEGLLATCIQHEIDHLEGILFIDYLSKLKKTMIIKKLSKQKGKSERIVV